SRTGARLEPAARLSSTVPSETIRSVAPSRSRSDVLSDSTWFRSADPSRSVVADREVRSGRKGAVALAGKDRHTVPRLSPGPAVVVDDRRSIRRRDIDDAVAVEIA